MLMSVLRPTEVVSKSVRTLLGLTSASVGLGMSWMLTALAAEVCKFNT